MPMMTAAAIKKGKNKKVCNERGIFMKHVITGLGMGIFILFLFIYFGLIGEVSFTLLLIINVACCMFVFYEPRIKRGSATASGVEVEMFEKIDQLEKKTNAIAIANTEPNVVSISATLPAMTCEAYGGDNETDSVIKAISGTKYTFRNIDGIISDSNLEQETAKDKLNWLLLHELATSFDIDGERLYALSPNGRNAFAQVLNPPEPKA